MYTTAIIAFREYLEAFLLIGIFVGIDRKLQLHRQKEILLAAFIGIILSLVFPILVFFLANDAFHVLTEHSADLLEGYLLTFSGFFLAYVIFSLHQFMKDGKKNLIVNAKLKMEKEIFDLSLFLTIILFIIREGIEVTILIASTSLFSKFLTNIEGLLIGFFASSIIGLITYFSYVELPIRKIFIYTEYIILIIGAAMVKNGVSLLIENYMHINLGKILSLPLQFLPKNDSVSGNIISNLTGLQKDFGIVQLGIMAFYVIAITLLFRRDSISK